jgi:DNA-binding transcriptional ArsR family regulator
VQRTEVRDAAPLFAALGDETRLQLVMRLAAGGPGSITHLSARSKVSRQAITKHLVVLSDAGLVRSSWRGRERCLGPRARAVVGRERVPQPYLANVGSGDRSPEGVRRDRGRQMSTTKRRMIAGMQVSLDGFTQGSDRDGP